MKYYEGDYVTDQDKQDIGYVVMSHVLNTLVYWPLRGPAKLWHKTDELSKVTIQVKYG